MICYYLFKLRKAVMLGYETHCKIEQGFVRKTQTAELAIM